MIYHIIAIAAGFLLDCILGDPYSFPHPVKMMGKIISLCDDKLRTDNPKSNRRRGTLTVLIVCTLTVIFSGGILLGAYLIYPVAGCVVESVMTYQALAAKSLRTESMKVYKALNTGSLDDARKAVSMIVGRDTNELDEAHVIAAAVETVAENTSDGVIAPLMYLIIGGPVLGFLYKAINTMDSMIGYKNDKYIDFGRFAAKSDDVVNFIPARLSAWLMIFSCAFLGRNYSFKGAKRIYLRDRFNHSSPNSAQTEAALAGALGLRLAGDASYFGKIVKKPFIGDKAREIDRDDIKRANVLMYHTTVWFLILGEAVLMAILMFCKK